MQLTHTEHTFSFYKSFISPRIAFPKYIERFICWEQAEKPAKFWSRQNKFKD